MTTIHERIAEAGITAQVRKTGGPMPEGWGPGTAYEVTLYNLATAEELTVPFYQGIGVKTEPTAADVLDSLVSDAASWINAGSFEEFAIEFGYDPDSRQAEGIYRACGEAADQLRVFLRDDLDAFLWNTEKL